MSSEGPWQAPADETALYRAAQAGDPSARQELVEKHWNLIWHIVHRFQSRGYDSDDLFQVGAIGLLKAIDRFEVSRGLKFSTYAVPLIMGEIRRHMRDDQPVRVARSLRELGMRVDQVRGMLSQRLGRDPTPLEVAETMGVTVSDVTEAMEAVRPPASLNQPIESANGSETHLEDTITDSLGETEWLNHMALAQAFNALDERERFILRAIFFEGKTQTEIARKLSVSQVQVSRLERRAIERIKVAMDDDVDARPDS